MPGGGALDDQPVIGTLKRYGLAMTVVPALVVATLVCWGVRSVILRDNAQLVATAMTGFVREAYPDGVRPSDAAGRAHLDELIQERIGSGNLGGLRLFDASGRIVYSSDADEIGRLAQADATRDRTLRTGRLSYAVTRGAPFVPSALDPSVEVVASLPSSHGPRIVMQTYKPYSFIADSVRASLVTVAVVIFAGAAITFTLFRLVILQAERDAAISKRRLEALATRMDATLAEQESENIGTIEALTALIDARDRYTALHSLHVAQYAQAICEELGCAEADCVMVERAALVHDIGKVGMPERVLRKPGRLTPDEWEAVRLHPQAGADIVRSIPFLAGTVMAVLCHHERWDGSGYPSGLSGEDIPLLGRVLAVADAFDAMTTQRPYSEARTVAEAAAELRACSGEQFDPRVVDAFSAALAAGRIVLLGEAAGPGAPVRRLFPESA